MTLEVKGLRKTYGDFVAVSDISFTVPKGEVLGLLGRNGAGKTTTIKMMLDLLTPNGGEVLWEGKPFQRKHLSIGYLPEERGLYPKTKIFEQLAYFATLEGVRKQNIPSIIDLWLERFEITEYKQKLAEDLSKGNQQKIQLIATLLHDPDIIILDEPFSGLDPVNATLLSDILTEEINKGKTIILSSHQMEQIERFCENVIMMKQGDIVVQGKLNDIKEEYEYKTLQLKSKQSLTKALEDLGYSVTKQKQHYQVQVRSTEETIRILERLQKDAFSITSFSMLEPSLHDIFVERVK